MSRSVWKFPLSLDVVNLLQMPSGSEIVRMGQQADVPMLWAVVPTEAALVQRQVVVVGTGHEVPEDSHYLGSTDILDGQIVLHAFEIE